MRSDVGCDCSAADVRFSNRPSGVKHFQTVHHCNVDVTHGLALLFGIGTGRSIMGSEDKVEQSLGRPSRQATAGSSGHEWLVQPETGYSVKEFFIRRPERAL